MRTLTKFRPLNFDNSRDAFVALSTYEIVRALLVFRACRFEPLVLNARRLLDVSNKVFGKTLTNAAVKHTIFAHFCAGTDATTIRPTINRLESLGVGSILDYAAESDSQPPPSETGIECKSFDPDIGESECDANVDIFLDSIKASSQFQDGFAAIKVTGLGRPALLEALADVIQNTRRLFFQLDTDNSRSINPDQFYTGLQLLGVPLQRPDADKLFDNFDEGKDGVIDLLEWTEYLKVEDSRTRPFFVHSTLKEMKGILPSLDDDQMRQFDNLIRRLDTVAQYAYDCNVRLMVDAEQTYFQPGIDHLVMNLQRKFNREKPTIFNTYQAYLLDARPRMLMDLYRARNEGFFFGVKLVRGAYMVAERRRAKERGERDPIQPTVDATHANFNQCMLDLLENLDVAEVMAATHNQESIEVAAAKMHELGIDRKHSGVYFGQLLGMSDYLSLVLGKEGYNVYKYIPFGPVEEVVPYLIRRAEENSSIMSGNGVDKEVGMLKEELFRRLTLAS